LFHKLGKQEQEWINFNNFMSRTFISYEIEPDSIYLQKKFYWKDAKDTLYKFGFDSNIGNNTHYYANFIDIFVLSKDIGILYFEIYENGKKCKCMLYPRSLDVLGFQAKHDLMHVSNVPNARMS
jgi:hypothetical protein